MFPGLFQCQNILITREKEGKIAAVLFDRFMYIGYNMLNKGAGR